MFFTKNKTIRVIVDHNYVMIHSELHQALVGLTMCPSASRHIWIVGPHELHSCEVHILQFVKVRLPSVVLTQVVVHNLCT